MKKYLFSLLLQTKSNLRNFIVSCLRQLIKLHATIAVHKVTDINSRRFDGLKCKKFSQKVQPVRGL